MCVRYLRFSKILKLILLSLLINLIFATSCFAYSWVETNNNVSATQILNYVSNKAWGYQNIWEDNSFWSTETYYNNFLDAFSYYEAMPYYRFSFKCYGQ